MCQYSLSILTQLYVKKIRHVITTPLRPNTSIHARLLPRWIEALIWKTQRPVNNRSSTNFHHHCGWINCYHMLSYFFLLSLATNPTIFLKKDMGPVKRFFTRFFKCGLALQKMTKPDRLPLFINSCYLLILLHHSQKPNFM